MSVNLDNLSEQTSVDVAETSVNVTTEYLKELIENNVLKIMKRTQKNKENSNYYISPNLKIKLYNCKLMIVTPTYFVLSFDKFKNTTLLNLLRNVDNLLFKYIKSNYYIRDKIKYPIHSETDDIFTIRCSLPKLKNRYFITCDFEDQKNVPFTLPRTNIILKEISVEIRNIWETPDKIGYNIEVKHINY